MSYSNIYGNVESQDPFEQTSVDAYNLGVDHSIRTIESKMTNSPIINATLYKIIDELKKLKS